MLITNSAPSAVNAFRPKANSETLAEEAAPATPADGFKPSEKTGIPTSTKVGKWALAATATGGAAALGWYAGAAGGAAAGVAGGVVGGLVGAVGLGTVGLVADLATGFGGNSSNNTLRAAIAGGVVGGAAGATAGLLASNPVAGGVLALVGGAAAFTLTGMATNILAK